jgi:excisionase family DNA binding protein
MFQHTKPRYSIKEILALLGIGRATLYDAIYSGDLESYVVGKKRRFISPEALDKYVERCQHGAKEIRT